MGESGGNSKFSVVPTEVSDLGKYAYDLADILRNALRRAGTEVNGTDWTSTAAGNFVTAWLECQDGGEKIIDALVGMAESLGVTAAGLGAHDNQFAAEVSSLDLPGLSGPASSSSTAPTTSSLNLPELG